MDSEGLLLLSDESGLNNRLLEPENAHSRTYLAQVEGKPSTETLEKLSSGTLVVAKHKCLPCRARIPEEQPNFPPRDPPIRVRKFIPDTWIEITLVEGKNRQVRKMTAAVGHPTLRLLRIAIGEFVLGTLAAGGWKLVSDSERRQIGIR